jgi:hydroxymethylbilane synthase
MINRIRIATRNSALALWQANHVKRVLEQAWPRLAVELVGMTTQGDQWLSAPLSEVGGKGLFIKELEQALLDGRAEIAVHSMKDVPAELPPGFVLPVIGFRDDVRDVLVGRTAPTVAALPAGAVIGSSSLRRGAQLRARRPDLAVRPIRGNVQTRLAKLDAGEFDALILAAAGLERLRLTDRITEHLSVEDSLPAAGQGALGIECAADNGPVRELLAPLNDDEVARCVEAERAVSRSLGGDCSLPIAAYAVLDDRRIRLRALLAAADGSRVLRCECAGEHPDVLGAEAAAALRAQGADEVLAGLRHARG